MKTFLLAAAATLSLAVALPAAAGSLTATGPNGGTYMGSRTCSNADSARTCYGNGTYTGPAGRTSTRSGTSVLTQDGWNYNGTVTRPSGRSFQTTVTRKR
jgi:hypothetical protein